MRKIQDYTEIIRIYNNDGKTEAYTFMKSEYGIKKPYYVMKRLKQSVEYHYDKDTDKFVLDEDAKDVESVFMNLDELCSISNESNIGTANLQGTPDLDQLIKSLIEDRLLLLSRYVQINQVHKEVLIDKTTMAADGFRVTIH